MNLGELLQERIISLKKQDFDTKSKFVARAVATSKSDITADFKIIDGSPYQYYVGRAEPMRCRVGKDQSEAMFIKKKLIFNLLWELGEENSLVLEDQKVKRTRQQWTKKWLLQ